MQDLFLLTRKPVRDNADFFFKPIPLALIWLIYHEELSAFPHTEQ